MKETLQRDFRAAQRRSEARTQADREEERRFEDTLATHLSAGTRTEEECARYRKEHEAARRLRDETEKDRTTHEMHALATTARALIEIHRELKDLINSPSALKR